MINHIKRILIAVVLVGLTLFSSGTVQALDSVTDRPCQERLQLALDLLGDMEQDLNDIMPTEEVHRIMADFRKGIDTDLTLTEDQTTRTNEIATRLAGIDKITKGCLS